MKIKNIHKRTIGQPRANLNRLFKTLATSDDLIWPKHKWPAIRFKDGLHVGSRGGHGRIRYTIIEYVEGEYITFQFTKPDGFDGTHKLYFSTVSESKTEVVHEINMNTITFKATILWVFVIRWLHDALIEEAFDTIENNVLKDKIVTKYSPWVTLLRQLYKKKTYAIKQI